MLKKIPLPFTGVMLGFAALGNLLQSYSEQVRLGCGIVAAIIGIIILLKIIIYPKQWAEDMNQPITASVFGTFSMAIMLLSAYAKPYIGNNAVIIWYVGLALHVILILYFTFKFILKYDVKKVFASYFIVYVGIAVASVSAPAFNQTQIGTYAFWFAFVTFIILLVTVGYRYIKHREIPEPARPLFCIFTAPMSLCLAGYIQSVTPKSKIFVIGMAIVSFALFVLVLLQIFKFLKLKFYPSYAAFTFPFVISAIAMKQTNAFLLMQETPIKGLSTLVIVQTILASILVLYAFTRYIIFIFKK